METTKHFQRKWSVLSAYMALLKTFWVRCFAQRHNGRVQAQLKSSDQVLRTSFKTFDTMKHAWETELAQT